MLADSVRDWKQGIPCPWPSLSALVTVRPGALVLAAGAPGALKSALALNWVLGIDSPTLYISIDTSVQMQAVRVIAHQTGTEMKAVYASLDDDTERPRWVEWLEGFDRDSKMRMIGKAVAPGDVGDIIAAWSEYWGEVPTMTVVDDISKLKARNDYQGVDESIVLLDRIAKKYNTVVMGIQHLNRKGDESTKPPRLRGMTYTGEYEAAYVLGLWRPTGTTLNVSVLKARTDEADPEGHLFAPLVVEPSKMLIREPNYFEVMKPNGH